MLEPLSKGAWKYLCWHISLASRIEQSQQGELSLPMDKQVPPFKHRFVFPNYSKFKDITNLYSRMSGGSNKTLEYFQPLGRERMQKLYQIFRIDFEMFEYSIDSYEDLFLWLCYIKLFLWPCYIKLMSLVKPKHLTLIWSHHILCGPLKDEQIL